VVLDTRHFTGNFPEHISLEASTAAENARLEDLGGWTDIIRKPPLRGDTLNPFVVSSPRRFTHLRMNIFPDGGVARLRVYGQALPEWRQLGSEIDPAAAEFGGMVVSSSHQHYGHPRNLIMPGSGRNMADGWETRRRRGPGHDLVILRLAAEGIVERVEVDTSHFKGNFPDSCSLEVNACDVPGSDSVPREDSWVEILPRTRLVANTRHLFRQELKLSCAARFARFNIYPDGGVSRLRLFGRLTEDGRAEANLAALNAASDEQGVADLLYGCGSTAWAQAMAGGRPYASKEKTRSRRRGGLEPMFTRRPAAGLCRPSAHRRAGEYGLVARRAIASWRSE